MSTNALRKYYEKLPNAQKDFKRILLERTGRDATTINRWINGDVPQAKLERDLVAEMTGLTLKELGYEK
ncbi:MAG: hypothetical protein M0R37_11125 [Bacteroidales bacterium]|nr:hypothetical protein [Bacteroidales bacterium]